MDIASKLVGALIACHCVLCSICAFAQTQPTGRIAGAITDTHGAVIVGASIPPRTSPPVNDAPRQPTNQASLPSPSCRQPSIAYPLPRKALPPQHSTTSRWPEAATTTLNVKLEVAPAAVQVEVNDTPPVVQTSSAELATTLDVRTLTSMPLPTRNFMQLVALAPGVSMPITDNRTVGRNTPNFSVNGARFSQNSLQINGVDATDNAVHDLGAVAVPAPESIREVAVQTSLYDASITGAGGGGVQVTTQSGTNLVHGSVYEYFRNDALNANDPDLKAAGGEGRCCGAMSLALPWEAQFARTVSSSSSPTRERGKSTAQRIKVCIRMF